MSTLKRTVALLLIMSAAALLFAGCAQDKKATSGVVLPPVREAAVSKTSLKHHGYTTFPDAFEQASAVCIVEVESWLGEMEICTFHKAKVERIFKGELPETITLYQYGSSEEKGDLPIFVSGERFLVFLTEMEIEGYEDVYGPVLWDAAMVCAKATDGETYLIDVNGQLTYQSKSQGKLPEQLNICSSPELLKELTEDIHEVDELLADRITARYYGEPSVYKLSDFASFADQASAM